MLPMATPQNTIVFASGHLKEHQMVRVGVLVNAIAIVLRILLFQFFLNLSKLSTEVFIFRCFLN